MRILILGDFSGRHARTAAGPGLGIPDRPILEIDVDNFERVLAHLSPRLELEWPSGGPPSLSIDFASLDCFHPDSLYQRLDLFRALRDIRGQVQESGPAGPASQAAGGAFGPRGAPSAEDDRATLERLLGRTPAPDRGSRVDITPLLRRIVEPYIVPGRDPRLPDLLASVDEATAGQMRAVLHHRAFQALESAWRGLHWLTTGLETGERLGLHILDVTREEIETDFRSAGSGLEDSGLFRLLVDGRDGSRAGQSWSLLVGNYSFGADPSEVELLGYLGAVAARAGGPFLAGADPRILGCRSLAETPDPRDWSRIEAEASTPWQTLRRSPAARFIGLAAPRVLLRRPYGRGGDETEQFAFEEVLPKADHETFLWGNPAFACAFLLGRAFLERGWSMEPGDVLDLADLPAHTYVEAGERLMTPCAEAFLTERAAEAILERGLMPLLSRREANAARLMRFQSLSDPPAALSGSWTSFP